MKLLFLRNCLVGGRHYDAGAVDDVDDKQAAGVLETGKAVEATKENLEKHSSPADKATRKKAASK